MKNNNRMNKWKKMKKWKENDKWIKLINEKKEIRCAMRVVCQFDVIIIYCACHGLFFYVFYNDVCLVLSYCICCMSCCHTAYAICLVLSYCILLYSTVLILTHGMIYAEILYLIWYLYSICSSSCYTWITITTLHIQQQTE